MRRSIILCAVVAIGYTFASTAFAQIELNSLSQSVSITVRSVVESKTYPGGTGPFNETVQDSYSDMTGRMESSYAQQSSSISSFGNDISSGGEVRFSVSGPGQEMVITQDETLVTFTLSTPASFTLTESSSLENDSLGGDGEVGFPGATLITGTSPVNPFQTNLIPYIFTLAQEPGAGTGTLNPITGEPNLTYSGALSPGTYPYRVAAGGNDSNNAFGDLTFSSDFQITPTPEPLTLSLLGMTALALLRRRSRRTANC
jgi:hypothetical protein